MKQILSWCIAGFLALAPSAGAAPDGKEDIQAALKKLAESSYSWKATAISESEGKDPQDKGITEGKLEKGGTALIKTTKVDKVTEAAFKGGKVAVKTADGWRNAGDFDPNGNAKGKLDKGLVLTQNLQKYQVPALEAAALLAKTKNVEVYQDGFYLSNLSDEGVTAYIEQATKVGKKPADLMEPKVAVKFWVRDGELVKYQTVFEYKKVKGKDKTLVATKETNTVEIKEIGSAKVELPEDVRKKLE